MRVNPRSQLVLGLLAVAVAALAVPAVSSGGKRFLLEASLKGNEEVPGPGDPNGKGAIALKVKNHKKARKRKICFTLEYRRLDGISAAHIHRGKTGVAGPVKVTLIEASPELPGEGQEEGCVRRIKRKLIKRLKGRPGRFYVNVHNSVYPDGPIRGQLERSQGI
jgi:hypothetical protein